jgi:hypothetical protein
VERKLRITPEEPFPGELEELSDPVLQVLDSQIQRQLDREVIVDGETAPETEFRHQELDEEFDIREAVDQLG